MPGASRPTSGEVEDKLQTAFVAVTGEVLAAPGAGFKWICYGFVVVALTAGGLKFTSAANDRTLTMNLGVNGGVVIPPSEFALFECADNEALNFSTGAGTGTAQVWAMKARV